MPQAEVEAQARALAEAEAAQRRAEEEAVFQEERAAKKELIAAYRQVCAGWLGGPQLPTRLWIPKVNSKGEESQVHQSPPVGHTHCQPGRCG